MIEPKLASCRDTFGKTLLELAQTNPKIVALSADLNESLRLTRFSESLPDQFFQIGVAEQNMLGVASGLALSGLIPFACSFGVFNPGRNWEQLRISICYSNSNVKIIGGHAGLSVGPDGASHQALEDLALTRVLPNLTVLAPSDAYETAQAVRFAVAHIGPVYIRFGREDVPLVTKPDEILRHGHGKCLREGADLTIVACGTMVWTAIQAAEQLGQVGVDVRVIATPFIKPLDHILILKAAQETGRILTIEDAQVAGGLGGAITEYLADQFPVPVHRMGVRDQFGQSGTAKELYKHYGLNVEKVVEAVQAML